MSALKATVAELFCYPVKGLSPQAEPALDVSTDRGLTDDRRFALALATTRFDPADPEPLEKGCFLMLRRNDSLAKLSTRFDGATGLLTVCQPDGTRLVFYLKSSEGRVALEDFFADYLGDACVGRPRLVEAEGHKFTDISVISPAMMRAVSVINLAWVRDLGERYGEPLNPLRFRGNIHVDGLVPWAELDWVGRDVMIGSARFRCVLRTKRCPAIDVDPTTGRRDTNLTRASVSLYGHPDCGVYLEVIGEGTVQVGDKVSLEAHAAA